MGLRLAKQIERLAFLGPLLDQDIERVGIPGAGKPILE